MLWGSASALLAFAVAIMAWALFAPYDQQSVLREAGQVGAASRPTASSRLPLSSFAAVWELDLRRPLVDKPVMARVSPATAPAPLDLQLAGTIIEQGRSLAVFAGRDGKVELKAVGEVFRGREVLRIEQDRVNVRYNGEQVTLTLKKGPTG